MFIVFHQGFSSFEIPSVRHAKVAAATFGTPSVSVLGETTLPLTPALREGNVLYLSPTAPFDDVAPNAVDEKVL